MHLQRGAVIRDRTYDSRGHVSVQFMQYMTESDDSLEGSN